MAGGDTAITAMIGLQSWNDDPRASHPTWVAILAHVPADNRTRIDAHPSAVVTHSASHELKDAALRITQGSGPDGSRV